MCGVCAGVHGYAHVCMGLQGAHRCVQVYIHVRGWVRVCVGLHTCTWVGVGACVHRCAWVYEEVCRSVRVSASVRVLDEFSEYLLETRVNTSADFNTYFYCGM